MHNVRQAMAAESKLYLDCTAMCNAYVWLNTLDTGEYKERENCLFAIPKWLGEPRFEKLTASGARLSELISYLKASFAKYSPSIFSRCSRFPCTRRALLANGSLSPPKVGSENRE